MELNRLKNNTILSTVALMGAVIPALNASAEESEIIDYYQGQTETPLVQMTEDTTQQLKSTLKQPKCYILDEKDWNTRTVQVSSKTRMYMEIDSSTVNRDFCQHEEWKKESIISELTDRIETLKTLIHFTKDNIRLTQETISNVLPFKVTNNENDSFIINIEKDEEGIDIIKKLKEDNKNRKQELSNLEAELRVKQAELKELQK